LTFVRPKNNAHAPPQMVSQAQPERRAKTDQLAMADNPALTESLAIKDPADPTAQLDQPEKQARREPQERTAKSSLANLAQQERQENQANKAHKDPQAPQASLERTVPQDPRVPLANLELQVVLAKPAVLVPLATEANLVRLAAATTAHRLVCLLDTKRSFRKRFENIDDCSTHDISGFDFLGKVAAVFYCFSCFFSMVRISFHIQIQYLELHLVVCWFF